MRKSVWSGEQFVLMAWVSYCRSALKQLAAHDERKWKQEVEDQCEDTETVQCVQGGINAAYTYTYDNTDFVWESF